MSLDATTWARHQKVGKGPAKAVLMALCDYANEQFQAYPSVVRLIEWTEQDRKTVLANLDRLKDAGWITDTGERAGQTKQVVVYQINLERGIEVKIGPIKAYQKRNSSKNGTVPNSDGKGPVFPAEQSQIPPETVPNLGHGTIRNGIEQSRNDQETRLTPLVPVDNLENETAKTETHEPPTVALRVLVKEGVNVQIAKDWLTLRKAKRLPLTPTAWDDVKAEGQKANLTPAAVVELALKSGWASFKASWLTKAASGAPAGRDPEWHMDMAGIKHRGAELGVKPQQDGEQYWAYKARVLKAAGQGPWIDRMLAEWRGTETVYEALKQFFNDLAN